MIRKLEDFCHLMTQFSGVNLFSRRELVDQEASLEKLIHVEEEIKLKLPEEFVKNYSRYNLQKVKTANEFQFDISIYSMKDEVFFPFEGFVGFDDLSQILSLYHLIKVRHKIEMLKIGNTPMPGGIFLGLSDEYIGQVFHLRFDLFPEEGTPIDLSYNLWGQKEYIAKMGDNLLDFINSLRYINL